MKRRGRRFPLAIAGVLVVLGAGIAARWLWPDGPTPVREGVDGTVERRIKEVTPAPPPKLTERDWAGLSLVELRRVKPEETNHLSESQIETWKHYHPWPPPDPNQIKPPRSEWKIFHSKAENDIAAVLTIEPGTPIYSDFQFDEKFVKSFLKAITHPIVKEESDTEYERNLKEAVKDAKIELKAAYDRGEDIAKIMNDTFAELQRLGDYKESLEDEAYRIVRKKGTTVQDAMDTIQGVNRLLEEKGIAPIGEHSISRLAFRLQALKSQEVVNE